MIGCRYESLPIAHATGGLKDTVRHLNIHENTGTEFLFEYFTTAGFRWAIVQAMKFYQLPPDQKIRKLSESWNKLKMTSQMN
jgi:glycogen synthase